MDNRMFGNWKWQPTKLARGLALTVVCLLSGGLQAQSVGDPNANNLPILTSIVAQNSAASAIPQQCGNGATPTIVCPALTGGPVPWASSASGGAASGSSCATCSSGVSSQPGGGSNVPRFPRFTTEGSRPNGPGPTEGIYTRGNSVINNLSLNYIHFADDLAQTQEGGVMLRRYLRMRNITEIGSFGASGFTQFDIRLRIYPDMYSDTAMLFDPAIVAPRTLSRSMYEFGEMTYEPTTAPPELFKPERTGDLKEMILLDANLNPVTSSVNNHWNGGVFAEIRTWGGEKYRFELWEDTSSGSNSGYDSESGYSWGYFALDGRLVKITDATGQSINIAYKNWTAEQLEEAPSRRWQMNTITDPAGRQMAFTYKSEMVGGQWAIETMTAPGNQVTTYSYNGAFLSSVAHPDGSSSTFTYGYDATSDCGTLAISDSTAALAGEHRCKTVYLTGMVAGAGNQVVATSVHMVRIVLNGENEVSYLSLPQDVHTTYIYEGGGVMKRIHVEHGLPTGNQRSVAYMLPGWTLNLPAPTGEEDPYMQITSTWDSSPVLGEVEPTFVKEDESVIYELAAGRPARSRADNGTHVDYNYDEDNWVVYKKFTDGTFESYCYNGKKQVTRYRDRGGNVTRNVYDSLGNLLELHEGLQDASSNSPSIDPYGGLAYNRCATDDVQSSVYAVTQWQYNAAGKLTAHIDALGNRTDYEYDAQNQLVKITEPADIPGGPRAATQYLYNAATGTIAGIVDPLGNVTQSTYDPLGRRIKIQYPDGSSEETIYSTSGATAGTVAKTVDRGGVVTQYTFDRADRLASKSTAAAIKQGASETPTTDIALNETWSYQTGVARALEQYRTGAKTAFEYDYRGRRVKSIQYPRTGVTLTSTLTFLANRLFASEDPYGRKTYFAYDSTDGRQIRTIVGTIPSYELSDFASVLSVTRSLLPNAAFVVQDKVYDSEGRVQSQFDGRGTETRYEYDVRNRPTNVRRAFGTAIEARTETVYDIAGNRVETRLPRYFDASDTMGYQKARETWTYTGRKKQKSHTEAPGTAEGATESFTYDLKGRRVTHTDFAGKVWTSIYDSCCDHSMAQKDPLGHGSIRNTNSRGQVVHTVTVADVDVHVSDMASPIDAKTLSETTTKYDGLGRPVASTTWLAARGAIDRENPPIAGLGGVPSADGLTTQYLYDDNLTDGVGLESASGLSYVKMAATGSSSVSLASAISMLASPQVNGGSGISFASTSPAKATVVINPQDEVSFTISDATGRTVMIGKLENYSGTANALLTWSSTLHDTTTAIVGYGDCLETRSIDALGKATSNLIDGAGRTIQSTDQLAQISKYTYDASGNRLSTRDPNNVGQDVVYDALGRAGLTTDTKNLTTNSSYDRQGNRKAAIDAKSKITAYTFDARGRQKTQVDRIGGTTTFAYLPTGQLALLTDAEGQTTNYTYDSAGRKLSEQYPDHAGGTLGQLTYGIVTFTMNAAGQLQRKQDQKGDTCTYLYDLAGRLTRRDYRTVANSPAGAITDSDTFSYDKAGRILTATSGRYANTVGYTYDKAGRKGAESLTIAAQTYTTTSTYNVRGELTSLTYPDGTLVNREYTDRGELYRLRHAGTVIDTRVYDNGGRMISSTYNNGVSETRSYNTDSTLARINFAGAAIGNLSYAWDSNKNKTSETIAGTMSNYGFTVGTSGYDSEDRLINYTRTSGLNQSWNLSPVGDWNSATTNGTAQTRTHGPTHELLTGAGQNVSTDVNGNITLIPSSLRTNASSLLLNWDSDNRLSTADVGNNGSVDVTYKFDALGRRVYRQSSSSTTVYVQSGQQTIADYVLGTTASSPTYRYIYSSYVDEPVLRFKPAGSESVYYHRNQQYSIVALTGSGGAILERYAYSAYGTPTITDSNGVIRTTSAYDNRYTYTGREWDKDLTLYHYRARIYDATLGRFCSRDPIGYFVGSYSLFQYCKSRPGVLLDPLGLKDILCVLDNCGDPNDDPELVDYVNHPAFKDLLKDYDLIYYADLKDLVDQVINLKKDGGCVKTLEIYAHSNPTIVGGINPSTWPIDYRKPAGRGDPRHITRIPFCPDCTIYLNGCNTGLGGAKGIAQLIADFSGCTVMGTQGYSFGTHATGQQKCRKTCESHGISHPPYEGAVDADGNNIWIPIKPQY